MYRVLYRKWRPQTFADVTGQPQVTQTLRQELQSSRLAHAYLFTGSRGTGKTTCAKILAKAINCLNPQDGEPCGKCEMCKGIDEGSVTDVVEIDAASNNGVDHIRDLRQEAGFTPAMAKYRVYIIDEVHMLSTGAFNALLKTLEEPPAYVVFILATTEVHKLPATILSRCQRFAFQRISPRESAERLLYIAEQEGITLDESAALLIARLADGALRDALSILDQCIGVDSHVTEAVVCTAAGVAGRDALFALVDTAIQQDAAAALNEIDRLYRDSKDMARLCDELAAHLRDLMLLKTVQHAQELLAVSQEEFAALERQAQALALADILHGIDVLQVAPEKIYRGANPRITAEAALLQLCTPQLDASPQALLRRIEALERRTPVAGVQASVQQPKPAQDAPAPVEETPRVAASKMPGKQVAAVQSECVEEQEKLADQQPEVLKPEPVPEETVMMRPQLEEPAQPLEQWPEILQILSGYSKAIAMAFTATSAYISGEYVLIDAPQDSMAFVLLRKSAQREQMRQAIAQVTGKVYKLGPYTKKPAQSAQTDPLATLAEQAEQAGITLAIKEE